MSDPNPEQFAEFATQDGPGSADVEQLPADDVPPARETSADPDPEKSDHSPD
ncbi:hypothetical protein ACWKSP_36190 [Micromonosporaceae bacterium Da 78-11]